MDVPCPHSQSVLEVCNCSRHSRILLRFFISTLTAQLGLEWSWARAPGAPLRTKSNHRQRIKPAKGKTCRLERQKARLPSICLLLSVPHLSSLPQSFLQEQARKPAWYACLCALSGQYIYIYICCRASERPSTPPSCPPMVWSVGEHAICLTLIAVGLGSGHHGGNISKLPTNTETGRVGFNSTQLLLFRI